MTAATIDSNARNAETAAHTLQAAHRIWLQDAEAFLSPLLGAPASFWQRWTAVRYLADQFLVQYHRECALLEKMRPVLPRDRADRLHHGAIGIAELQRVMDEVGRRRGTGLIVSGLARKLLDALGAWCTDLEAALQELPRDCLAEQPAR